MKINKEKKLNQSSLMKSKNYLLLPFNDFFNIKIFIFFGIIIFYSLISCINKEIKQEKTIDNHIWNNDSIICFDVQLTDAKIPYDVIVKIEHTNEYPKSNLWLFTRISLQDSLLINDTLDLQLARYDGKWLGKRFFSIWEYSKIIKTDFTFPKTGTFKIKIEHAMRFKKIQGITSVGILVKEKK